jgi:RsiW-degrading membrane proteinase PrsW (M82 family)
VLPTLTVVCTLLPTLLLLRYFYARDLNPEPRRVLLVTFVLGALVAIPVALLETAVWRAVEEYFEAAWSLGLSVAFLVAAFPEEYFKFLVLYFYCAKHEEFEEPMDGMVYGAVVSLGFATFENILFVLHGGLTVALGRALTAVPAHAFWGALMGYYLGMARFRPRAAPSLYVKALAVPILLHGLYDFPLLTLRYLAADVEEPSTSLVVYSLVGFVLAAAVASFQWILAVRRLRDLESLQLRARQQQ